MNTGVYRIRNLFDGKEYIGSAAGKGFNNRWVTHKRCLLLGNHHSYKLQKAYNHCGIEAFSFEIIEFVEPERCLEREQFYLDRDKPFYNVCLIAGSTLGKKHKPETIEKLKILKSNMTEETRRKIGDSRRGKKLSPEIAKKLHESCKNSVRTEESREKYRQAQYRRSKETQEKMLLGMRGRKRSPEAVKRIAVAQADRRRKDNIGYVSTLTFLLVSGLFPKIFCPII